MGVKSSVARKLKDPGCRQRFELRASAALLDVIDEMAVAVGVTQSALVAVGVALLIARLHPIYGTSRQDLRQKIADMLEETAKKLR
jgi:hypothetical protein